MTPGALGHQSLDLTVPAGDAVGPLAVGAQQSVLVERVDRGLRVAGFGSEAYGERGLGGDRPELGHRLLVLGVDQLDVAPTAEHLDHPVGIVVAQRLGQVGDPAAEAVGRAQRLHRRLGASAEAVDQVGEHRARLDRGQLARVADQDQPGVGADRLEQPGHHRQRDHRGLVDHDHVVRQPVGAVVPEPDAAVGAPAEQPVQGRGLQVAEPVAVGLGQLHGLGLDRLLQPGRRLAGRGAQRDPEVAAGAGAPVLGLLGQQREQARDGRGLAGAGSAGQHGGPAPGGLTDGGPLLVVPLLGEDPQHAGLEDRGVDLGGLAVEAGDDVAADLHLLAPVAVEVEQRVVEPEHLLRHQRARGDRGLPGLGLGPRQLLRLGLVLERAGRRRW